MEQTYEVYYDEIADFLEVFIGTPLKSDAEEIEPGVFLRRDSSGRIRSIGIFSFKKRAVVLSEILSKVNLNFPLKVSI